MCPISTGNGPVLGPVPLPGFRSARNRSEGLLKYFGFRESPFGVTPNPEFLYSSRMHLAALQSMIQSIESNLGFTVLLGDPGMGKTTLLFQLLSQYRDSARTAFIFQTQCKRYELLRYLASELELPVMNDEVLLHQRLKEMLVNEAQAGQKVLIFIDEGQNLHHSSLEAIRLLSDFETARAKLLHIILAGSARLGETLLTPELSQLAQRITTICRLAPLPPEEVKDYILFRLRVAECRVAESLFSPEALAEVADQSEGVPRVVNSICYRSLSLAYALGERRVSGMLVRQAARDLDLSHSGTVNWNTVGQFPRTSNPPGSGSFPAHIISEEKHTARAPKISSSDVPEAATKEKTPFQPAVMSAVVDSIQQTPSSPAQAKATPETHRREEYISETNGTRRNSPQHVAVAETRRLQSKGFKNDPFTLVLVGLIAISLGLWGYQLGNQSRATVARPAGGAPVAGSIQNQKPASSSSEMLYSQNTDGESNPGHHLIGNNKGSNKAELANKTHAPVIPALQQSLLPSKIRQQPANSIDAAPPVAPNISSIADNPTLPVVTSPTFVPAPQLSAGTAMRGPTTAKQPIRKEQIFLRQPIRTVSPKYPKLAELRHIEGDVLLELQVDSKGKVQKVQTISGNSLLGDAAEEAARQWQYPPYSENQFQTPAVTRVRFTFKLDSEMKR
jgi:TonB family protein